MNTSINWASEVSETVGQISLVWFLTSRYNCPRYHLLLNSTRSLL